MFQRSWELTTKLKSCRFTVTILKKKKKKIITALQNEWKQLAIKRRLQDSHSANGRNLHKHRLRFFKASDLN